MQFEAIPSVQLLDLGVSYRYLVFRLKSDAGEKLLVRGMNFRPYEEGIEGRIINQTLQELSEYGFQEGRDELAADGGGSASFNPYYETLVLFGAAPERGAEDSREEVFALFQQIFPGYTVTWYSKDHADEVERREKEAKAKAAQAAKAKKEAAEKAAAPATPRPSAAPAPEENTEVE